VTPAELAADFIIAAITDALEARSTKQALLDAVTAAVLAASDAEMHRELDPTDKA
jgi:hypothetical protein